MKLISKAVLALSLSCSIGMFSSCETSKIAYGNSYYFKATPQKVKNSSTVGTAPPADELLARQDVQSAKNELRGNEENLEQRMEKAESHLQALLLANSAPATLTKPENKEEQKLQMLKKGKHERKQLKKEVKELVKTYKRAPEKLEEVKAVSKNTKTGIILSAVGLILVLIGGNPLYTIGAVVLVVGLVLILLDVL